ncbi:FdtA/QdtA family cupin domain-containing protein [Bradyrhizobium sp. 188]|nr:MULTISPECIES: FdtA/QdtA family cupin domain-containing protein [unclassified Bradyrhizobium]MCK1466629.1 WxcM-like domain-containing protein [Bradyrhizobium sp. CW10]MCK1499188.1 WxcM-like domain-containing protein [Bradyrhizobium sp. 188]
MKVTFVDFDRHGDERGMLVALEEQRNIPFTIRRVYYLLDTKLHVRRGYHAHRQLKQIMLAVSGSVKIHLDNGHETAEVSLDNPYQGLLLDSMVWREMFDFSRDCVLMVLADRLYDPADYIRDYQEFCTLAKQEGK